MIHMPQRSVTRFFIPLIDVLLLLFCIFLLMPIASETELDSARDAASDRSDSIEALQRELARRTDDLQKFEKLQPQLLEVSKLKEELDRLRETNRRGLQQRAFFQIIDVDGKTGGISYFDPMLPAGKARIQLATEQDAHKLIERHLQEAGAKREVYYYFLYPRYDSGFPTVPQERRYKKWFASVANSLRDIEP